MKRLYSTLGLCLILASALGLLPGCSLDTPDAPLSDNPFDPANPETGGDPYKIQTERVPNGFRLTWRPVNWPPLTGYNLYRRTDDSLFAPIQQLEASDTTTIDRAIQNGHRYEYYVVVTFAGGEGEHSPRMAKASLNSDPALFIEGETVTETPTRNVELTLIAYGAENMLLSNTPDFAGAVWEPFSPVKAWQLTTGAGTKRVYGRIAFAGGDTSETVADEIEPAGLRPALQIIPDSLHINHTNIMLSMPNVGALEMKITETSDSSLVEWQPYQSQANWNLSDEDGWKHIYAWFGNEFFSVGPVIDSVGLDTRAEIASFDWTSNGGDTLVQGDTITYSLLISNDAFGNETQGTAFVKIIGWENQFLEDSVSGSYGGKYVLTDQTPEVVNAPVIAFFTDRVGNKSDSLISNRTVTADWLSVGDERDFSLGNTGQMIRMCWIPAGNFNMGSPANEVDRNGQEGPAHHVIFASGFWMGKFEVTQAQWMAVMRSNPASDYGVGGNYPVYNVSWDDIQQFELLLSNFYSVPSEAEWEYACRAGTVTRFYWGDDPNYNQIADNAWYNSNGGSSTHPVGGKGSNAWGLHDMSGNVWEWCEDWYHSDYTGGPNDGSAWINDGGFYRVLRGGSWLVDPSGCRSANRGMNLTYFRHSNIGFRLVRDAE